MVFSGNVTCMIYLLHNKDERVKCTVYKTFSLDSRETKVLKYSKLHYVTTNIGLQ